MYDACGLHSGDAAQLQPQAKNEVLSQRLPVLLSNHLQVLRIVYLGNDEKGGFFPKGLTGAIVKVNAADLV